MEDVLAHPIAVVLPSGVFSSIELELELNIYVHIRKVVFTYLSREVGEILIVSVANLDCDAEVGGHLTKFFSAPNLGGRWTRKSDEN